MNLTTFKINGNKLKFVLLPTGKPYIKECKKDGTNIHSDDFFRELIESPLCNGLVELLPEQTGDLTSSLIFALVDDCTFDDRGVLIDNTRRFWYPNYQVRSPVQDFLDYGYCEFTEGV